MKPAKKRKKTKKKPAKRTPARSEEPVKRSLFSRILDAGRRLLGGGVRGKSAAPSEADSEASRKPQSEDKRSDALPDPRKTKRKRKEQQDPSQESLKSKPSVPSLLVSDWDEETGLRERSRPTAKAPTLFDDTPVVKKKATRSKAGAKGKKTQRSESPERKVQTKESPAPAKSRRSQKVAPIRPRGPVDLVIGLDFGTSCTKVMIRSPYAYGGRVVPVALGPSKKCPFLLPAVLYQGGGGSLRMTKRPSLTEHSALKLSLMNESEDPEVQARAAAYLALVIRKTKAWFDQFEKGNYLGAEIRWSINLGIPAETFDDEEICRTFREVLEAGWVLSESAPKLSIMSASAAIQEVRNGRGATGVDIGLVPEVAAAVKSYATSMERKNGLHLAIDVGAGTVDVCGFILHTVDEEDAYPILKASVTQQGAFVLHQTRMDAAELSGSAMQKRGLSCEDPGAHVPDDLSFYAHKGSKARERIEVADVGFERKVANAIMEVVMPLKMHRYPLSLCWEEGLPTFFCGGASHMEFYKGAVETASDRLRRATGKRARFLIHSLACQGLSTDIEIEDADFRRLVVAAGLSHPIDNIGKIRRESTIQDETRIVARPPADLYISKDQV